MKSTIVIGKRFHRWTVLSETEGKGRKRFFLCRCRCGVQKPVRLDQLTRGISKSCGCWKKEVSAKHIRALSTTHGQSNRTRTYSIWKGIRKRCLSPASKNWPLYGGRGIHVCAEWSDYSKFLADMGEAPAGKSIDRIDTNGHYEPGNCRWADKITQMNNMRTNVIIQFRGERMTLKQWSTKLGIPYHRLYQRLFRLSWPIQKAFTSTPRY
jgi:hypothetical protein